MASKYAKFRETLPKLPIDKDPKFGGEKHQEKVEKAKKEYLQKTASELVELYETYRKLKDEKENELKSIQVLLDAVSQCLVSSFEENGISSLKLLSGGTVRIDPDPILQYEDKEKFRLWCIENGYEREMHLVWQTANALLKAKLVAGEPYPDGLSAWMRDKISYTKPKGS